MKKVLLTLALFLTAATVAKADQTAIEFRPSWPVNCANHDYPTVNSVSDIERLSEDEDQVTFGFKTTYGACVQNVFEPTALSPQPVVVTERNRIVLFQKQSKVGTEITFVSPTEIAVKLTFDKRSVFKNRRQSTFTMIFKPNGDQQPILVGNGWGRAWVYAPNDYRFWWDLTLTEISATRSSLSLNIR